MEKSHIGSSDPIEIRLEFPHLFGVEILRELPGQGSEVRYFPVARDHGRDGVLLRVTPERSPAWDGLFGAEPSGRYKSGVYSCPDENTLCVVSNGSGYILDVRNPDGYEVVPVSPIFDVICGVDAGLLIFANFTDVLAWDRLGRRWLAERLSFDGIRSLQVQGGVLHGVAWSPMDGNQQFSLDLATGARLSAT